MSPVLIPILALCIPLVAVFGRLIVRPWLAHRELQMEMEARMIAEKAAQYAATDTRLEQRVAVLERILTDRSTDLAHEIERLRDNPLN